ncbi:hypothetical protein [uncultured Aquimarina sp.]|uniref:hypothetical protein n=1 Tax=uncultured Aquimarina sp. TaxID=575652 RepID=UPI0026332AFC|nr:hypothetical protein [uncultured Aquimarina sp.]
MKKTVNILYALVSLLILSCSVDKDDLSTSSVLEPEEIYNYDSWPHIYNKKEYSLEKLLNIKSDIMEISYLIYDIDKKVIYIFDEEKDVNAFNSSNSGTTPMSKLACTSDRNSNTWGFKLRMWEHDNFRGRFVEFRRTRNIRTSTRFRANIPSNMNDKISSIVIDELDTVADRNGGVRPFNLICYEDYNSRGRKLNDVLSFSSRFRCGKEYENLRRGNWSDVISSIEVKVI